MGENLSRDAFCSKTERSKIFAFSTPLPAATWTFNGTTSGSWGVAGNWLEGTVPTSGNTTDVVYYSSTAKLANVSTSYISENRTIRSIKLVSKINPFGTKGTDFMRV